MPDQSGFAVLAYWFGVVIGVTFVGIGILLLLPREVTTTFELRSHRVVHRVSIGVAGTSAAPPMPSRKSQA